MTMLIAYASRFGSTREIAERIADVLRRRGQVVVVRAVDAIADPEEYGAVVLGSGVYDGSWTEEANAFVRRHAAALARKPVWIFTVGSFGDTHPLIGALVKKEPKEIDEIAALIHPREYRVFAGVIALEHWPSWARLMFRALGGRDGDNRRWDDIEAWAATIADDLDESLPRPER